MLFKSTLLLLAVLLTAGCSSTTSPSNGDNVLLQAQLTTNQVSAPGAKGAIPSGNTVTSVTISSVQFLIAQFKLESKSDGADIKVKDGPAILSVDASGAKLSITGTIPAATYDKASFKIHRLTDDERTTVASNPDYAGFITNDRASVVVNGSVVQNGQTTPFTYYGKIDETFKLDMDDLPVVTSGQSVIALQLDPVNVFKDPTTKAILDPRDITNWDELDNLMKSSLKMIKK